MRDIIYEILDDIIDQAATDLNFTPSELEDLLSEGGFMIVPIEDPTNLRFGVDE